MSLPYKTLSFICLCLAVCAVSSTVLYRTAGSNGLTDRRKPRERENIILSEGYLSPDDVQYFHYSDEAAGIANESIWIDVTFYTSETGNITYILAYEEGESQNAAASIMGGGLYDNIVTIFIYSDIGRGYNYSIEVYGKEYIIGPTTQGGCCLPQA